MTVRAPPVCVKVYFNIASAWWSVAELDDGTAKIRAAFATDKSGVKYSHGLAVQGFQLLPEQSLMLPDGLEQFLRRQGFAFAQNADAAALQPPPRVKTVWIARHLALLLRRCPGKVKASLRWFFLNEAKG